MKLFVTTFLGCLVITLPALSQGLPAVEAGPSDGAPVVVDYETARFSKIVEAVRINNGEVALDGLLSEPVWGLASPATDFVQQRPNTGQPSQEHTEVRFIYDDDNLCVGVNLFYADATNIIANGLGLDFPPGETDSVNVVVSSLNDGRSAFSFTTNPLGGKRDQQVSNDGQGDLDWEGVWDVVTSINDEGWIAEFTIPFKTLRFSNTPAQEWGLNVGRRTLHLNENSQWSPVPIRYSQFRISLAGTLTGLENIRQGRNLQIKPFATGGIAQSRNAEGQFETQQSLTRPNDYDGGVDLKYGLTQSLTLDATYRTDFAQVEVDEQQVNLSRFSLFFPERRDFFLENSSNFTFGPGGNLVPFFSRRIGLSGDGKPIPIVGGTRVSGRVNQYDIGLLAMQTERLNTTPANTFLVGRVKRNLLTNSWVGALVTNRDSSVDGDYNRVYGGDAYFQFYNRLQFDGYFLRSDTPDKDGEDHARRFAAAWRDDELVLGGEYNLVQGNFNPEVGFVRRGDMVQYAGEFEWSPLIRSSPIFRNLLFGTDVEYYAQSRTGKVETRIQEVNVGVAFENGASITVGSENAFDRLSTTLNIPSRNPRVGIPAGDYGFRGYSANFRSGSRYRIGGNGSFTWGEFYNGNQRSMTGNVTWRANNHLNLNLRYDRNHVTLPDGEFTTNIVATRVLYAFNPRVFINAFVQYNADTHRVSTNIRFDWRHHPLSDLYIVYNDSRDTISGQLRERAFIIKLTNLYRF